MIRLLIKLAVVIAAFVGSLYLLLYYIACAGAEGVIPFELGCPLSLALVLLAGDLGNVVFPQKTLAQKKTIRVVSRGLFLTALSLWFFYFIVFIALAAIYPVIRYLKKKQRIGELFADYLQKQGIQKDFLKDMLIRFSPWRLLRDRPAWVIEAEFADTPGIRRYSSEDGVIMPEN